MEPTKEEMSTYKKNRYSQEEIDFYKPYFPTYTEEDIVNMLFDSEVYAALEQYKTKNNL